MRFPKTRSTKARLTRATVMCGTLLAMTLGVADLSLGKPGEKAPQPVIALTESGNKLASKYSAMLDELRSQITAALPKIDMQQASAFVSAYQTEALASKAELDALRGGGGKKPAEDAKAKHEQAIAALAAAKAAAQAPVSAVMSQVEPVLASDALDAKLVKFMVLHQATPEGLAAFAQESPENEALVSKLLDDTQLMKQMALADGASDGKYGQAMQIYSAIQAASPKASEGVLQRLALATALEHAAPVRQANPSEKTDAPATIDPVARYQHFEKAYLDGELDPAFKDLSVWDMRLVVNGDEPDETLAWGRQMLRNYRPDIITNPDFRWRYVQSVKTEVKYGSQDVKNDLPSLQPYQNMIMNGGVCGRRAFFGRFILRSFGVPTAARPQKGHATLVHWTPKGWVINLGAGWGWGWLSWGQDRDFLAYTQARMAGDSFVEVKRANWIASAVGEKSAFGFHDAPSGLWTGITLYRQQQIIDKSNAEALAAVGTDIGEANESKEKDAVQAVNITDEDRKIVIAEDGTITVPAAACTSPANSTEKVIFMPSNQGGLQMHYGRLGKPESVEYTVDAPAAGKYALTARVVTTSDKQTLLLALNGQQTPTEIAMPFTIGMWDTSAPIEVTLNKGANTLLFTRPEQSKGLTIRDFTLTPVK